MSKKTDKDLNQIIMGGTNLPSLKIPQAGASDDDLNNILSMSQEEIEKLRKEKLEEIEKQINNLKSQIKKEDIDNYVLENKIELLEKAKFMLNEYMVTVLSQISNVPRAYDVLAQMFLMVSDLNKSVIEKDKDQLNVKIENHNRSDENQTIQNTTELIGKIMEMNYRKKSEDAKMIALKG